MDPKINTANLSETKRKLLARLMQNKLAANTTNTIPPQEEKDSIVDVPISN